MKILRVILILLVPAMGIVGCQKSDVTPKKCSEKPEAGSYTAPESTGLATDGSVSGGPTGPSTDIYGTGDDDRDGGDKKTKKR